MFVDLILLDWPYQTYKIPLLGRYTDDHLLLGEWQLRDLSNIQHHVLDDRAIFVQQCLVQDRSNAHPEHHRRQSTSQNVLGGRGELGREPALSKVHEHGPGVPIHAGV